jgi:hypothetical protein
MIETSGCVLIRDRNVLQNFYEPVVVIIREIRQIGQGPNSPLLEQLARLLSGVLFG